MNVQRREISIALALSSIGFGASAQGNAWKPTDRITYVLGVTPGGSVDIGTRLLVDRMAKSSQVVNSGFAAPILDIGF